MYLSGPNLWLLQTEEEIAETEVEIRRLEESIDIKMKMSKVAHSRLENRMCRPNEELCHDNVQYGITDEVKQLGATIRALQDKLRQSQWVDIIMFNCVRYFPEEV